MEKNLLLKNVIYKFSLNILKILIPVVTFPYIYRVFNPETIGRIEFAQSISNYFMIFAGFGVYNYGLREISRLRNNEDERNKIFSQLLIISVLSTVLTFIFYVLYIFLEFKSNFIIRNMLLINGINILSQIIYTEWINEAFENYKFISLKTIIIRILNLICIFIFIKEKNDYYKYLLFLNFFIFCNNFISFIYIKKYIKFKLQKINLKKYLLPLGVVFLVSNISMLYSELDRILLGFYSKNIQEVAFYGIAQRVMSLLIVTVMSVVSVTMPRLSFYLGENRRLEYENMLNEIISFMYFILFPISIGLIILSKEIVIFFGGEQYLPAQMVLIISGIRIIFVTISSLLSNNVIFLKRKEKIMLCILIIGGGFNFFIKLLLIKINFFNSVNAAFTTMLVEIFLIILEYFYIKKFLKMGLKIFKLDFFKYLLFSLSFFIIKYIYRNVQINSIFYSILIFICCAIIYIFLLILFKDKCLSILLKKMNIKMWRNANNNKI